MKKILTIELHPDTPKTLSSVDLEATCRQAIALGYSTVQFRTETLIPPAFSPEKFLELNAVYRNLLSAKLGERC